jgi:hypothetical protein
LETAKAVIFVKDAAVTMPLAQGIVENVGVMAEAYYAQRRDCAKILDDFRSGTVQASGIHGPRGTETCQIVEKYQSWGVPKPHGFIVLSSVSQLKLS